MTDENRKHAIAMELEQSEVALKAARLLATAFTDVEPLIQRARSILLGGGWIVASA